MAEIRVEEKRGSLAWLWVLILVALVALGVWWWMNQQNAAATAPRAPASVDSAAWQAAPSAPALRLAVA
ncbi:MAG TPA: hypothetical protein VHQ45_00230 [Gemmatimonadaceae bacterium]|jgi:cytoskeletal protein RodZ|nr:hypothetical protein [Gemmatimonadaceae bacterium]